MNERIVFVLVEGKHDSAALTRLLRLNGFHNFTDRKISQFNENLKGFVQSKINDFIYEDESNIWQRPQLPNYIISDGTLFFLFYQMNGDTQSAKTIELLKPFKKLSSTIDPAFSFSKTQPNVSLLFFYDADESIGKRKQLFIDQYKDFFPEFIKYVDSEDLDVLTLMDANSDGFTKVGLYIYGKSGTLEDLVIPLMKDGNMPKFDDADSFLQTHMNGGATHKGYTKALIGTVGQLENPGKANQVIITDTKSLDKSKFDKDPTFVEILNVFKKF